MRITRAKAKAAGLTHFFTDAPCKNGHMASRYVANGRCVECFGESRRRADQRYAMKKSCAEVSSRIAHGFESAKSAGVLLDIEAAMDIFKTQDNAFEFIDSIDG